MHNFRTLLVAVLFVTPSWPAFAQDPGQATVQMQQSDWPSPDRYHGPSRRIYGYRRPDYTCPQQSVVVGLPSVPRDNLQTPASSERGNDAASREITSAANASSTVAVPPNRASVSAQAPGANPPAAKPYAILTCGTFVRLEFAAAISSKTAQSAIPLPCASPTTSKWETRSSSHAARLLMAASPLCAAPGRVECLALWLTR